MGPTCPGHKDFNQIFSVGCTSDSEVRHSDMSTDTDTESDLELAGEALWPMSSSVRMRALLLELSFPAARPGGQVEDRGSGYNYGRKWTYLQGEYQTSDNFS